MNRKKFADPTTTYNINRINSKPAKDTFTEIGLQTGASIPCRIQTLFNYCLFLSNCVTPREELGCACTHTKERGSDYTFVTELKQFSSLPPPVE